MANPVSLIRTTTSVLAASAALLAALRDNPEIKGGIDQALTKIKSATDSRNPKLRFEAKLTAIETAADAVETEFGRRDQAAEWRQASAALRMRGELIWHANEGRQRRKAMKALNSETTDLLERINTMLRTLTPTVQPAVGSSEN